MQFGRVFLLVIAALAVIALVVLIFRGTGSEQAAAIVYGDIIGLAEIEGAEDPQAMFACIVQNRVTEELVQRLGVETSRAAIVDFGKAVGLDLTSSSTVIADQRQAAKLADALESVVVGGQSAEESFTHHNLKAITDIEEWKRYLSDLGNPDGIAALRNFSSQPVEQQIEEAIDRLRPIYLSAMIEKKICMEEPARSAIDAEVADKLGDELDQASDLVQSVWNHECRVKAQAYLQDELDKNVEIRDPTLANYDQSVTLNSRCQATFGIRRQVSPLAPVSERSKLVFDRQLSEEPVL